jgi:hypothetical protein
MFSLPHTSLTEGPWESLEKDCCPTAKKVCLSLFRDPWDGREGGGWGGLARKQLKSKAAGKVLYIFPTRHQSDRGSLGKS